jgi:hypothetical protein
LRAAWADVRSVSARPRGQLVEALRRLYEHGRLVVAKSELELRVGSRRGHAIDTRGVAELLLASRVLEDLPPSCEKAA